MAYTEADLDRVDKAIASGRLSVTIDGHSTTYRSLEELERIRTRILRALESSRKPIRAVYITARSGLR